MVATKWWSPRNRRGEGHGGREKDRKRNGLVGMPIPHPGEPENAAAEAAASAPA